VKISSNFNRFIFGVVLEDLKKSDGILKFEEPKFKFRPKNITKESLRNLLKHLDFDYPRDDEMRPLSYTKLDSKQMSDHIAWIERTAGNSGIELDYIAQEWERIMKGVGKR
jgi:hypothetical protein